MLLLACSIITRLSLRLRATMGTQRNTRTAARTSFWYARVYSDMMWWDMVGHIQLVVKVLHRLPWACTPRKPEI